MLLRLGVTLTLSVCGAFRVNAILFLLHKNGFSGMHKAFRGHQIYPRSTTRIRTAAAVWLVRRQQSHRPSERKWNGAKRRKNKLKMANGRQGSGR